MQEIACSEENPPKKISKRQNLLNNADDIIEMIANNNSYRVIASKYNVDVAEVFWFVNQSQHSAQAKQALQIASYDLIDKAQQAIESIEDESSNARVARQRELKNIYLYRAQCKNPREFNLNYREDKQETNNNIITPQLTLKVVNNSDNQLKITNNEENN